MGNMFEIYMTWFGIHVLLFKSADTFYRSQKYKFLQVDIIENCIFRADGLERYEQKA